MAAWLAVSRFRGQRATCAQQHCDAIDGASYTRSVSFRFRHGSSTCPLSSGTTLRPERFLIALRRRLRLPLPMCARSCEGRSCRRRLDALGDHRASCMRSGRVQRRTVGLERTWMQVFTEAGARVYPKRLLRDTTVVTDPADGRQLDFVAVELPGVGRP